MPREQGNGFSQVEAQFWTGREDLLAAVVSSEFFEQAGLRPTEIRYLQEYEDGIEANEIYREGLMDIWHQVENRPDAKGDFRFVAGQWAAFLSQRGLRALEIQSSEVKEAAEIALRLHGMKVFITECIDGRNSAARIFGYVPGDMGGSHRTDAGKVEIDENTGLLDRMGTFFSMVRALVNKNNDRHCQAMGAHLGCAAKGEETQARFDEGEAMDSRDGGFAYNVARKAAYVRALKADFGEQVVAFEYNFDSHHGGVLMFADGIRVTEYLDASDPVREEGLTYSVLDVLEKSALIVSSGGLFEMMRDRDDFKSLVEEGFKLARDGGGEFDWTENYPRTALAFWRSVEALWNNDELRGMITEKVASVAANHGITMDEDELRLRSLMLAEAMLQTTFVTHYGELPWPGDHEEKFIKLSQTEGPAPFRDTAFLYTGENLGELGDHVMLMARVVRNVRKRLLPGDVLRPILLLNVSADAELEPSVQSQVAGRKLLADRWRALQSFGRTKRMMDKGGLVVLNLEKAMGKYIRGVMQGS